MAFLSSGDEVFFLQRKIPIFVGVVLIFFSMVVARLYYLQIFRGREYQIIAEQISLREEEIRAPRGLILDRNEQILADERLYFEIVMIPQRVIDIEKTLADFVKLVPVPLEELKEKIYDAKSMPPFMPVPLVKDAPYDWVSKLRELEVPEGEEDSSHDLEGIEIRAGTLRSYRHPEIFSHVLGYLKEVDRESLKKLKENYGDRYSSGDWIGASGLEASYDLELRGEDGIKARVVDARGRELRGNDDLETLAAHGSQSPKRGRYLMTSLDLDSQMAAAKALGDRKGAVVALEPATGEVLVLYSSPGFDVGRLVGKLDRSYWQQINLDPNKILYNRAIMAAYPPGSTYKVVGALAGLDSGNINNKTHFHCGGGLQFGNRFFQCWKKGGHGSIEITRALTQSCDVFFYQVGLKMGVDGLKDYAHRLGLGEKTGIDLPYEQPGLIPSTDWKSRRFKQSWIESETLSVAIGQGYDLVTPLQNARMIAMIANGGRSLVPHVGRRILDPSNFDKYREISFPLGETRIKVEDLQLIQKSLIDVVHGQGTARRLASSPHKIAGKTGTAQVIGYESKARRHKGTKDHALFIAYAPYDDPKIAVSVLVENGGHGGSVAAPVAQAVIDTYLK